MRDLGSCTVGLVGYGNVAKRVEQWCGMGTPATRYSHLHPRRLPPQLATAERRSAESDIVSLHLPLTGHTAGLLDRAALAKMRPDAVLVNTSRGAIVDEAALVDALRAGTLAAAGLDVFAVEPVPADNPLLALDNVVLTPTSAGTRSTRCAGT